MTSCTPAPNSSKPYQSRVSAVIVASQVGKPRPESISCREMRTVKRSCLTAIETLLQILCLPEVEISHLGPIHTDNPKEMTGWNFESSCFPCRHLQRLYQFKIFACSKVQFERSHLELVHRIANNWWGGLALFCIRRCWEVRSSGLHEMIQSLRSVNIETSKERGTRCECL